MTGLGAVAWSASVWNFYRPQYWNLGTDDYEVFVERWSDDPRPLWDRLLDEIASTGVAGIEISEFPAGWESLVETYGGVEGTRRALEERDLKISSSYMSGEPLNRVADEAGVNQVLDRVGRHAHFLAQVGAELMLIGPPERTQEEDPDSFTAVADALDRAGAVTAQSGVRLALHTEAYSMIAGEDDVNELMQKTSPARLSLCIDSGHVTLHGSNAVRMLDDHFERVAIMHWKDCATSQPSSTRLSLAEAEERMMEQFRPMGQGIVDWTAWADVLRTKGFAGWATAEIDMVTDPVGITREVVDYANHVLADPANH